MRIFATRALPGSCFALLKKRSGVKLDVYDGTTAIPRKELLKRVQGAHVLISLLTDRIDDEVFAAAGPDLRMVANYAVGFDNVDLVAAGKRNVIVTNTPVPEVSESVAEHTVALLFGLAHRIVESDTFTRKGKYRGWNPSLLLGNDVAGKTLGIIGSGAIGTAVAKRMHDGFGVRILYTGPHRNTLIETAYNASHVSLARLLKESDFVSLHVPLTPKTRHLIGASELRSMKETAFLINTSRGPVVDEKALVRALTRGVIAGAGLDVYECEPFIDCDPHDTYDLRTLPNVILTPHTASATNETREAMGKALAHDVLRVLSGKRPEHGVRT